MQGGNQSVRAHHVRSDPGDGPGCPTVDRDYHGRGLWCGVLQDACARVPHLADLIEYLSWPGGVVGRKSRVILV